MLDLPLSSLERLMKKMKNEDSYEVGVASVVVQSTEAVASTPILVQSTSSNVIYEGVGCQNSNDYGSTYCKYGS